MSTVRNLLFPLLGALVFLSVSGCLTDTVLENNPCEFPGMEGYTLTWSDEFDAAEIDLNTWTYELGDGCQKGPDLCGWGNNELEWYTNEAKNSFIRDGNLVIRAIEESTPVNGYNYTSARMISRNKADFKFGRMDIRAKLPRGKGLWPAIWMLSTEEKYGIWPKSGEIDIMELLGDKPREVLGTVHYGNEFWQFKSSYYDQPDSLPDFSEDFHTFTLLWRDDCIRFMVDGNLYGNAITPSVTLPQGYPFNEKFYFLLNVAVGGNLPGSPDATTVFPQEMVVDYVRVYQEN